MKKVFAVLLFSLCAAAVSAQQDEPRLVRYGDPFIMLHDGTYYAYGTSIGKGFEVFVSDDLLTWKRPEGVEQALYRDDTYGAKNFWAPEVYHLNGRFYMFYTAEEHTSVAVADSPLGPFRSINGNRPYLPDEKNIDNHLFIDDDGRAYLFFDRFNDGLNIWVADLADDLQSIKPETMTKCVAVSQDWERCEGRVNEGGFVIKHKGKYYLTYSGNGYTSQNYGIGFAVADDIHGEWTKYEGNPIYQNVGDLVGIGHSAMFRDKKGRLRIVFHAHKDKDNIHPRGMYISSVGFKKVNGRQVMVIDPDYITPVFVD